MNDTTTPILQKLAGEAFDAFEQTKRDEETITVLRDDAPQWVRDAVYGAHGSGEFFPDDWRYDKIQDAFGAIHDASENTDMTEVGDQFCDGAVDIYTAGRLKWLASNLNRPAYCDEARAEFGGPADAMDSRGESIIDLIGMGQYMEAREIFAQVHLALDAVIADIETCDECGEAYPPDADSEEGPWHAESCSLNTRNVED